VRAPPTPTGRVVLVTGASAGIGRVAAHDLAARGDTVVTVSRPEGRGAAVAEELRGATGGDVHHLPADLSLLADARALAEAFRARWGRLDALLLNAGAFYARRSETREGIESTWALNHFGALLPAILLADLLVASAPARVVLTSSNAAIAGRIAWDDPELKGRYGGMRAYAQSKLANQLATLELARRFEGRRVTVHAFHPGFVATDFGGGSGALTPLVRLSQRLFGRSPAQGADTLTFLATDGAADGSTARFWVDRRVRPMAPGAREADAPRRLWDLSVERAALTPAELATLA